MINLIPLTGKLMCVEGPQYLSAAKSYALAALSSMSYPPKFYDDLVKNKIDILICNNSWLNHFKEKNISQHLPR